MSASSPTPSGAHAGRPAVLMIEDDHRLAAMVREYLDAAGYRVAVADDGARGLLQLARQPYALVLLDLMLPDADGLDLCRRIRAVSAVPIIMVTARGELADRVAGLELGADDYLAKPFEPRELLARIRSVLRRYGGGNGAALAPLRFGRLEIDRSARQVRVDDSERVLTARQFDILVALAESAGRVLSREQLIARLERDGADAGEALDRAIDVHMVRIRAAIEDDPRHPRRILTVRGAGYLFAAADDP